MSDSNSKLGPGGHIADREFANTLASFIVRNVSELEVDTGYFMECWQHFASKPGSMFLLTLEIESAVEKRESHKALLEVQAERDELRQKLAAIEKRQIAQANNDATHWPSLPKRYETEPEFADLFKPRIFCQVEEYGPLFYGRRKEEKINVAAWTLEGRAKNKNK